MDNEPIVLAEMRERAVRREMSGDGSLGEVEQFLGCLVFLFYFNLTNIKISGYPFVTADNTYKHPCIFHE